MEVQAVSKSVRMSPRKIRLVADSVRHLSIGTAFRVLQGTQKRGAGPLAKTLKSAVANAVNNAKLDEKDLVIKTILVNEGQSLKRFRPSTRGRIHPYKKRGSHITVVVESNVTPSAIKTTVEKPETKKIAAKVEEQKTEETKKGKKA